MKKTCFRYCGALGGLLGPLLLGCQDSNEVCEPVAQGDGSTLQQCYQVGDFGKSTLAQVLAGRH